MGRRKRCRFVAGLPPAAVYKPQGVPLGGLAGVVLPVEGLEALRLVDAEGLDQEAAAARMGVSRPTLNRILGQARAMVARALSNGWAIRIEGGDYAVANEADGPWPDRAGAIPCGRGRGRCGQGQGGPPGRGGR